MSAPVAAPAKRMQKIVSRYDSTKVLFECEIPDDVSAGMAMRYALEKATTSGADLRGAYLIGADLRGAYLSSAYLRGAYLRGADLRGADLIGADLSSADLSGADLSGADLSGADLSGAYLRSADLSGADLSGADLSGKKLSGLRPFLQIGPIGSRSDYLQAFVTDSGVMIRAGCFFDTRDQFELALTETHGDNEHAQEYRAALTLIDMHAKLYPAATEEVAA